jgi:hypothetical protein
MFYSLILLQMNNIIGLDVSKKTVIAFNSVTQKITKLQNNCKDLEEFIKTQRDHLFIYESTWVYSSTLQKTCNDCKVEHFMIHPNDASSLSSSLLHKNKNDDLDAKQLSQLAEIMIHQHQTLWLKNKLIKPASNEVARMRSIASQIRYHKECIEQIKNRIEKLNNDSFGIAQWIVWLQNDIISNQNQIKALEASAVEYFVELWLEWKFNSIKTIPWIWEVIAIELVIFFTTLIDKWISKEQHKQMLAYSWLNPKQQQSWTSLNYSSISRNWDAHVRKAIYMAWVQWCKRSMKDWYKDTNLWKFTIRMKEHFSSPSKKRWKSVICAVWHKLLNISWAIFHSEQSYQMI